MAPGFFLETENERKADREKGGGEKMESGEREDGGSKKWERERS